MLQSNRNWNPFVSLTNHLFLGVFKMYVYAVARNAYNRQRTEKTRSGKWMCIIVFQEIKMALKHISDINIFVKSHVMKTNLHFNLSPRGQFCYTSFAFGIGVLVRCVCLHVSYTHTHAYDMIWCDMNGCAFPLWPAACCHLADQRIDFTHTLTLKCAFVVIFNGIVDACIDLLQ